LMAKKQAVSPEASGGAGTLFEYRVAAVMLGHLLCHSHPPGLQVPVVRVGLQQRVRGHLLDDVVVYGEPGPVCTEFQIKRTLAVTGADRHFIDVVTQALHVMRDRHDEVVKGELGLGVIAQGRANPVEELANIAEWAHGHGQHGTFAETFVRGVRDKKYRSRWEHVKRAVAAAIDCGAPDLGGVEYTAHALLAALNIWRPALSETGRDYRMSLDELQPVADGFGVTSGTLFAHLAALAEGWGPVAGVVDAGSLRRRLRRRGLRELSADSNSDASTSTVDIDAVVRGPIKALALEDDVARAEKQLTAGDAAAIDTFARVAKKLRAARFTPHATTMTRKRADALQRAGRQDEAVRARVDLAWEELDRLRTWEAGFALHDGRKPGAKLALAAETERIQAAADAAVGVAKGGSLDRLVGAFDALVDQDRYVSRAAAFLCEEAIAAGHASVVSERLERLRRIARECKETSLSGGGSGHTVRLQMCLADVTDEWIDLLRDIHHGQPRPIVAWAHARYARHLAISGDGAGAQENYLEAIERASAEDMLDEAADWLYSLRVVRFWYDSWHRDEQHPLAQALRAHARFSALPGSPHTAELALHALLDDSKTREALQRALRWRWQAFVRAQLTDELAAVEAIGRLQERQGNYETAIQCYTRAGSERRAAAAAAQLPDREANLSRQMLTAVPNCRAAAYSAAAAAADLMSDDESGMWADEALEEIRTGQMPQPLQGPSPYLKAFDYLASACLALRSEQDEALIDVVEPLIDRPAGSYWLTDEAVAKILTLLATRRPEAVPLLSRAIIACEKMANIILNHEDVLVQCKDVIIERLVPVAASSRDACLAIILAGGDPAPTLEVARTEVDRILRPRAYRPNVQEFRVGAPDTAVFASVLDQQTRGLFATTVLDRALDQRESKFSRWNDLAGLCNIAVDLDPQYSIELIRRVLEVARGEHDSGAGMDASSGIKLSAIALQCAARLNPNREQSEEIEQIGTAHIRTAGESDQWRVVHALVALPLEYSRLSLQQCAVHPVPGIRTLAAIRWAKDSTVLPLGQATNLAKDSDYRVRRELARALSSSPAPSSIQEDHVVNILAADIRRSVRTLAAKAAGRGCLRDGGSRSGK
jgi:tetratricopeptide (TPR) repeat protein